MTQLIKDFEQNFLRKKDHPNFRIGDTIKVHLSIKVDEELDLDGGKKKTSTKASKERIQVFTGTVIAKKGTGVSETFTVYRNSYGSLMERVFMLHSPKIAEIKIVRSGKVRRAKLTYIRGRAGKASKIKEKLGLFSKKASVAIEKNLAKETELPVPEKPKKMNEIPPSNETPSQE